MSYEQSRVSPSGLLLGRFLFFHSSATANRLELIAEDWTDFLFKCVWGALAYIVHPHPEFDIHIPISYTVFCLDRYISVKIILFFDDKVNKSTN